MRTLTNYISRFVLILVFVSGLSFSKAAAHPSGRLIVIRAANFGWNLAPNLKIDGEPLRTLSRVAGTITVSRPAGTC